MGFETFKPKNTSEEIPAERESHDSRIELTRLAGQEILTSFNESDRFMCEGDINALYATLPSKEFIVRREDPETLMHAVNDGMPVDIRFIGDTPYANSVLWNPINDRNKGLDTAILEGQGHLHNVVTVYEFTKPEGMYLGTVPQEDAESHGTIDRSRVRAVAGFVPIDSIEFIIVRIPMQAFPQDQMTEQELDTLFELQDTSGNKPKAAFIYRGYKAKEKTAYH